MPPALVDPTPPTRARRTQEERRTTTRRALLDATAARLVSHGYAATTTTEVARRAGVSQGALFKHFASKDELMVAVAAHTYGEMVDDFLVRFRRIASTPDPARRLDRALDVLWALFQSDGMAAALELEAVSRTDAVLRAGLGPVVEQHAATIRAVAAELFPELVAVPGFASALDLVFEAMHGMAASRATTRATRAETRLLAHLQQHLRSLLIDSQEPR